MTLASLGLAYFRRRPLLIFSAVAIALGVAVLFAVLAVMNGFLAELQASIRSISGDAVIEAARARGGEYRPFEAYEEAVDEVDGIRALEPRLNWYGLIGRRGAAALSDPRSTDLSGMLLVGVNQGFDGFETGQDARGRPILPMRLGVGAAERLGLEIGDILGVITFVQNDRPGGRSTPQLLQMSCRLVETVKTGRYDQDLDRAELPRTALAEFLGSETGFTEILIRTEDAVDPELVAEEVENALQLAGYTHPGFGCTFSWRDRGGNLLRAVENQRGMLSIVFFFIVLVAAYQLVATLTLTVTEKRRDIGVLRALGATPGRIIRFYVSLGLLISLIGIGLGLLLGQWLIHNLTTVEKWVGGGQPIFRAEIYKFDHIPVAVDLPSVLILVGATLAVAVVFSLVPAWRASRVRVIDGLRAR
ncbi:MAG: hypothetical protein CMJ94_03630 [Planctomycetes bacterium]|nr:hypothetical protein [Planctomycetota bacterium]